MAEIVANNPSFQLTDSSVCVRLVNQIRGNHESGYRNYREDRRADAHHEKYLSARARGAFAKQRPEQSSEACGNHRRGSVDGQQ